MSIEAELAKLREEVAALRKRVDTLSRCITIETDDYTGEPLNINLRCGVISFAHPDVPSHIQAMIGASPNGPYLHFYDFRGKGRATLGFEKNEVSLTLRDPEMHDAVLLRADTAGRGMAAVLDKGRPRALMKAGPDNAGNISAVHDDGQSRIFLRSTEAGGELMAVADGTRASVKITSITPDGSGLLHVSAASGTPAVILGNTALGGCVIVNDPFGNPLATLPPISPDNPDGPGED